jgi:hypothetical protein
MLIVIYRIAENREEIQPQHKIAEIIDITIQDITHTAYTLKS